MQMMYRVIAKEIKSMKLENAHPLDYLNFYCIGKREQCTGPGTQVSGDAANAAKVRTRFIISCV